MQEEWAASLERAQQLSGGGGRRPGATILDACTLDPKAWHENVPSLLCASSSAALSLPPNPEASPEEWEHPVTAPQEVGRPAHRVPEARESVFGLRAVDRVCTPAPRPSGLASPCRGQPHSAGHPAQQTWRWPEITGTPGRLQPAPLTRGPANGPGDPDSPPLSLSLSHRGKSNSRSSGLGNCSAGETKGCATLRAFETSHLLHLSPNEKQEELQLAGKADAPRGWQGRAFIQIDLHSLPPWGPSCPTEAPQRAFPSNREQAEVRGCVWGSPLMVQMGGHGRIRPRTGSGTGAMVLVPTVPGGPGCDSHKDWAHPIPTSRCENTHLGDSRGARGPLPRDAASLHQLQGHPASYSSHPSSRPSLCLTKQ